MFFFFFEPKGNNKKSYQPNPHACNLLFFRGLAELCLWSQSVARWPGFLGGDWEVRAFWASSAPGTDCPGDSNVMGRRSHLPGCVAEPRWRPYTCPSRHVGDGSGPEVVDLSVLACEPVKACVLCHPQLAGLVHRATRLV